MDLTERHLTVLHAVRTAPGGLRKSAYRAVMPDLVAEGLVVERPSPDRTSRDETAYFLTPEGWKALREAEPAEAKTPDPD